MGIARPTANRVVGAAVHATARAVLPAALAAASNATHTPHPAAGVTAFMNASTPPAAAAAPGTPVAPAAPAAPATGDASVDATVPTANATTQAQQQAQLMKTSLLSHELIRRFSDANGTQWGSGVLYQVDNN